MQNIWTSKSNIAMLPCLEVCWRTKLEDFVVDVVNSVLAGELVSTKHCRVHRAVGSFQVVVKGWEGAAQ